MSAADDPTVLHAITAERAAVIIRAVADLVAENGRLLAELADIRAAVVELAPAAREDMDRVVNSTGSELALDFGATA